jgi:hypothetical protein
MPTKQVTLTRPMEEDEYVGEVKEGGVAKHTSFLPLKNQKVGDKYKYNKKEWNIDKIYELGSH